VITAPSSEFARGWRTLAGCFLGIAIGVSSIYFYSLGIFIKPMAAEFNWSRGQASLGAFIGTGGAALMSLPLGRIVDRVGSVPVAIGSLAFLALGFGALAWFTTNLAAFLVVTGLLSILAVGSSPLAYTRLVVAKFDHRRGLALGIALSGTGVGAILVPRLLTPYVAQHGWRSGYWILAETIAVALVPLAGMLLQADRAKATRARVLPVSVMIADPGARLLGCIFFLAAVAVFGTVVHFVSMLSDWGLAPATAGALASLIGAAAIGGRLLVGAMLDRASLHRVCAGLFATAALGIALLGVGGPSLAALGAVVVGVAIGAEADLIAFFVARLFPKPVYGQMYGALYAVFLVGGAIGPLLSGYLHDVSGSYRLSLLVMAGLMGLAALLAGHLSNFHSRIA